MNVYNNDQLTEIAIEIGKKYGDDNDIDEADEEDQEPAVSREAVIKLKASIEKMEEAITNLKRVLRELGE